MGHDVGKIAPSRRDIGFRVEQRLQRVRTMCGVMSVRGGIHRLQAIRCKALGLARIFSGDRNSLSATIENMICSLFRFLH